MDSYYDPRTCSSIIRLPDREYMMNPEMVRREVTNEIIRVLVERGLRTLQRPQVVTPKKSFCWIPSRKLNRLRGS